MSEKIEISKIRRDGGTQPRAGTNETAVAEYAEAMKAGAQFPPVMLFYDGSTYWLADGFHRVAAAAAAGLESIDADILQGTQRAAVLHSVGVNGAHGLRRTTEDKRRAIETLLRDPEWRQWSDRQIAEAVGVDHKTVGARRGELIQRGEIPQMVTVVTRHSDAHSVLATDSSYPPVPSENADVETARLLALEVIATSSDRDALKAKLAVPEHGTDTEKGYSWQLGKGYISTSDSSSEAVTGKQIAMLLTTANGTGVYRFDALQLWDWAVKRDALIEDKATLCELLKIYSKPSWVSDQIRGKLIRFALAVSGNPQGITITGAGRALAERALSQNALLAAEQRILRAFNGKSYYRPTPTYAESTLITAYDAQAAGEWARAGNMNGHQGEWAAVLSKHGYMKHELRPDARGGTYDFYAITPSGCELLGRDPMPIPALPDQTYHPWAKMFIPQDATFQVKVGDYVKSQNWPVDTTAVVTKLGKWPELLVNRNGYDTTVYEPDLEIIDAPTQQSAAAPDALSDKRNQREEDAKTARVWECLKALENATREWGEGQLAEAILDNLEMFQDWIADTPSGERLGYLSQIGEH